MQITNDTTALITGANGGIGQAIAKALHAKGAKLIVTGRRADALEPLAKAFGARVIVADLAKREDVERCLAEAGPVDVFVANAALPSSGALSSFDVDAIDRALEVNLRAPIRMAHALAPGMVARGRGQLVFISSVAGKIASPGSSMYSATKFGLRGFALGLREDLHGTDVGVTTVFPGFIRDAGMFADTKVKLPALMGTRSPEDVARAVVKSVTDNPAEILVAAMDQSFGVFLAGLHHPLVAAISRRFGGNALSEQISSEQATKR